MDEKEARLWIKLEWKALRKALNTEGEEQQIAIRDALIFRGSNRELYPSILQLMKTGLKTMKVWQHLHTLLLCTNSPEEYQNQTI